MYLTLYSGQHCHLCDLAVDLIADIQSTHHVILSKVDIASDHQLTHLYGARIPVLKREDTQTELGWPFDKERLEAFLG